MKRLVRRLVLATLLSLGAWYCGNDSPSGPGGRLDETPPPRPRQLRVDRIGDGEVWLSWIAVVDEPGQEMRYVVHRAAGGSAPVAVDTTLGTTFGDHGLEYETEFTYQVTAMDAAGNQSVASNTVSGQPFNNLAPMAPTGLRAFAHNLYILSQLDITLDWDANAETDLARYRVYRSLGPGVTAVEAMFRAEVDRPRFVDQHVQVGAVYHYCVTAVDRGGKESQASDEVSDVPLALPELVSPVQGDLASTRPAFRWHPVPRARKYQVIVTTSPTSGEISAVPLTQDTTATFTGRVGRDGKATALSQGRIYYWKVVASTREDGQENSVSQVESFKAR